MKPYVIMLGSLCPFFFKTMHKLHIANTFFEWELESSPNVSLCEAFSQHPIFLQLQFLPVLYANSNDALLFTNRPISSYWELLSSSGIPTFRYFTLEDREFLPDLEIESWGPSRLIAEWAKTKGLHYFIPDWNVVKEVNSKRRASSRLPG